MRFKEAPYTRAHVSTILMSNGLRQNNYLFENLNLKRYDYTAGCAPPLVYTNLCSLMFKQETNTFPGHFSAIYQKKCILLSVCITIENTRYSF